MENVIQRLKEYVEEVDLTARFDYSFEISQAIFSDSERNLLLSDSNPFQQNIRLKWLLKDKYQKNSDDTMLDFWIINQWGGIRSFKPTPKNIDKIRQFKKQLNLRKLTLDSFYTISSLSKIASFIDPDKFVIYDSRVIYALNWLILKYENRSVIAEKYFPMPSGRNKIIVDFDMNTVLNLSHLAEYSMNKNLYYPEQLAYFKFCDFVETATSKVYGNTSKPFELEMLLFTLADSEIFEDLKSSIKITRI
jgi:hypothetical protein